MFDSITPMLITFNEAPNIKRTLDKLTWAKRVVVIDSGSTDGTLEILQSFAQDQVFHRQFQDYASQCNFGLEKIDSPWVLSLDADYELSDELVEEIAQLTPSEEVNGYRVKFIYKIFGRRLRGSLYPPRVVLYRRRASRYVNEGHGHRASIQGDVRSLAGTIFHDDRKPLARWLASQQRYARDEARYICNLGNKDLKMVDRLRFWALPAPFAVVLYTLFVKGCIWDGRAGWYYTFQRALAEVMLALELLDLRLRCKRNNAD